MKNSKLYIIHNYNLNQIIDGIIKKPKWKFKKNWVNQINILHSKDIEPRTHFIKF